MFHPEDPGFGWGDEYDNVEKKYISYGEYYDRSQVSLQPGGILRLTAVRLIPPVPVLSTYLSTPGHPVYRLANYKSGMIQLKKSVTGYPFDAGGYETNSQNQPVFYGGYKYGMFEIRMKIPPGETFPAFWLIGPTQFNIYEGKFNERKFGVEIDNEWDYIRDPNDPNIILQPEKHPGHNQWLNKLGSRTLADDFHTYTGVWTPTQVTFFFDGREICTFKSPIISNLNPTNSANSIIASMQMKAWSNVPSCHLDIDYIKVYKPIGNDYTVSYKSTSEFMNYDAFRYASGTPVYTSATPNSMVTNPNNSNEVFYRSADNKINQALKMTSGNWNYTYLGHNDGPAIPVAGDIRFLPPEDLIYVGNNNRINLYARSTQTSSGFYHWYITSNWNCPMCNTDDYVSTEPGSLQTSTNGEIFYRGLDNKMHWYHGVNGNWVHQILASSYNGPDYVTNNIAVDNSNTVFYRGNDGRLQCFWKDNNGVYQHLWVDNNWTTSDYLVLNHPGSLVCAPNLNGVLYIGTDTKIHSYLWNFNTMTHALLPYNYSSPSLGYPDADLALGGLSWDNTYQRLYYAGYDGRIQYFGKTGTQWWHSWVDDHWNTDEYNSIASNQISGGISSNGTNFINIFGGSLWGNNNNYQPTTALGGEGLFYTRNDGHLSYFAINNCEILNPEIDATMNLSAKSASNTHLMQMTTDENFVGNSVNPDLQKSGNTASSIKISISPNPATEELFIRIGDKTVNSIMTIHDVTGRLYKSEILVNVETTLKIADLSTGLYIITIQIGSQKYIHKFSKI